MTNTKHKSGKSMSAKALQVVTLAWAILGLAAILLTAAVLGDWDLNAFSFYLVIVFQFSATVYLSVLAILWELSRTLCRRAGILPPDKPFGLWLHRILLWIAVGGCVTAVLFPLILGDFLPGQAVLAHYAFGILLLVLYPVWGISAMIRCVRDHRCAERQRLADEKQAWEGYLS